MVSLCLRKDSRQSFCLWIQTFARHTLEPDRTGLQTRQGLYLHLVAVVNPGSGGRCMSLPAPEAALRLRWAGLLKP